MTLGPETCDFRNLHRKDLHWIESLTVFRKATEEAKEGAGREEIDETTLTSVDVNNEFLFTSMTDFNP